jgi:hypothetical protein
MYRNRAALNAAKGGNAQAVTRHFARSATESGAFAAAQGREWPDDLSCRDDEESVILSASTGFYSP